MFQFHGVDSSIKLLVFGLLSRVPSFIGVLLGVVQMRVTEVLE